MQIILMEKVANLGQLGDIVKVKDGLRPQFPDPAGQGQARHRSQHRRVREAPRRAGEGAERGRSPRAQERAGKLEGLMVQVTQKAGVDGAPVRLGHQLRYRRGAQGAGLRSGQGAVRLPHGPLKQVGDYDITLDLHTDVKANIKVSVLGEQVAAADCRRDSALGRLVRL